MQFIETASTAQQALIGLGMVSAAPEEVDAADVSRDLQLELTDQLHSCAPAFAQLVDRYSQQALESRELFLALLRQARAWLSCGMTFSKLFLDHRPTFDLVCAGLHTADVEVISQSCGIVREISLLKEYPRPDARTEALRVLLGRLNGEVQALLRAHQPGYVDSAEARVRAMLTGEALEMDADSDVGAICAEYSSTYATLASGAAEGELLCTGYSDPAMTARESDLLVGFYSALMGIIRLKPRKMAFSTFDFWAEFGDFSAAEWHPHVRGSVMYELLCAIVCHSTYPADSIAWSGAERDASEDQEDFVAFRDARLGIAEAVKLCLSALSGRFFAVLQAKFEMFQQPQQHWMHLEVVLFLLCSCMDDIKEMVMKLTYKDKAYQKSVLQFLYDVTQRALSIPVAFYAQYRLAHLHQAVCRFLGSLTFLLVSAVNDRPVMQLSNSAGATVHISDFYFMALRSALEAVGAGQASTAAEAARAVHKLCVHGCKRLLADVGDSTSGGWQTLCFIVQTTAGYIKVPNIEVATLLVLVEAATRCIMEIDAPEVKSHLLGVLGESVVGELRFELTRQSASINDGRVVSLLSLVSQLVRFSDVLPADGADGAAAQSAHPLLPFLTVFWPVMQDAGRDPRLTANPAVGSAIFEIFGKVLRSVGSAVFSEVPNMVSAILAVTESRGGSAGAALQCAAVLVECLGRPGQPDAQHRESQALLLQLVTSITDMYALSPQYAALASRPASSGSSGDCMALFGAGYDAMEQYFSLVHAHLIFGRAEFFGSSAQLPEKVLGLCCMCLAHCAERDPLRALLHALQVLLVPASRASEAVAAPTEAATLHALAQFGALLTLRLLQLLSEARVPSSLVPNITESLYCLIIACDAPSTGTGGAAQASGAAAQCGAWIEAAVMTPALFLPLMELEQRQLLVRALLALAESRSRRFKSLVLDVFKICSSESTVDTLLAYT